MRKPVLSQTAHPRYTWRVHFTEGEKRRSKFFKTKAEAKTFAEQQEVELDNHGRELFVRARQITLAHISMPSTGNSPRASQSTPSKSWMAFCPAVR